MSDRHASMNQHSEEKNACTGPEGEQVVHTPMENHKWLYVSLEILVRTPSSRSNWTSRIQLLHKDGPFGLL